MQHIIRQWAESASLTDLVIGTVTKARPLEVTLVNTMLPLPASVLLLTESVIEKKINITDHRHNVTHNHPIYDTYTGGGRSGDINVCSTEQGGIFAYENGKRLPRSDGFIILNRGLAIGDKVLMLRVMNGQNFIILSRVF
jgi:hypothetical protein